MKRYLLLILFPLITLQLVARVEPEKQYDRLILTGFNVQIVESNKFGYEYDKRADVEVKDIGRALSLRVTGKSKSYLHRDERIKLTIYMKREDLRILKLVDSYWIDNSIWKSAKLRILVTSTSEVNLGRMDIKKLSMNISSGASSYLNGRVGDAKITITAGSTLGTSRISGDRISINASSSGKADVSLTANHIRLVSTATSSIEGDVKAKKVSLSASANSAVEISVDTNELVAESTMGGIIYVSGNTGSMIKNTQTGGMIHQKGLKVRN